MKEGVVLLVVLRQMPLIGTNRCQLQHERLFTRSAVRPRMLQAAGFQSTVAQGSDLGTVRHVVRRVQSPGLSSAGAQAQSCQSKSVSTRIGNTCRLRPCFARRSAAPVCIT